MYNILPLEIRYIIYDYLDIKSLLNLNITNNLYWKHRYNIDFGKWKGCDIEDYKNLYKQTCLMRGICYYHNNKISKSEYKSQGFYSFNDNYYKIIRYDDRSLNGYKILSEGKAKYAWADGYQYVITDDYDTAFIGWGNNLYFYDIKIRQIIFVNQYLVFVNNSDQLFTAYGYLYLIKSLIHNNVKKIADFNNISLLILTHDDELFSFGLNSMNHHLNKITNNIIDIISDGENVLLIDNHCQLFKYDSNGLLLISDIFVDKLFYNGQRLSINVVQSNI